MHRFVAGTKEYLSVTVRSNVLLDDQTVAISIDKGVSWLPAVWEGSVGLTRQARTSNALTFTNPRRGEVLVKVTDLSETPIMEAGDFMVVPT